MTGLAIMSYVFARLVKGAQPTFEKPKKCFDLQIFEAMVSGAGKSENSSDEDDAMQAVKQYESGKLRDSGEEVFNLAAAALQKAGYSADLSRHVYVVKSEPQNSRD